MEELLREYDPFPVRRVQTATDYQREILDLFNDAEKEGEETTGRRFIRWRFIKGLGRNLTPDFMAKIRERVSTSFYLRHVFAYQLRNIEDGTVRAHSGITNLKTRKNGLSPGKKSVSTTKELKGPARSGLLKAFSTLTRRLCSTGSRWWEQGLCLTACATLPIAGRWWRWTRTTTTCAYGGASQCTEGRAQIVAQTKPEVSPRVSVVYRV